MIFFLKRPDFRIRALGAQPPRLIPGTIPPHFRRVFCHVFILKSFWSIIQVNQKQKSIKEARVENTKRKVRILGKLCPYCLKTGTSVEGEFVLEVREVIIVWECPACKRQFDNRKKETETSSNKERPP